MSYNGIGLSTVRGSGTSGYVQANASTKGVFRTGKYEHRQEMEAKRLHDEKKLKATSVSDRKIDKDILEHEEKRKIEIECIKLEEELEEMKKDEETIEKEVEKLREKLLKEFSQRKNRRQISEVSSKADIHAQTISKKKKNERMEGLFRRNKVGKQIHDDRERPGRGEDDRRLRSDRDDRRRRRSPESSRDQQSRESARYHRDELSQTNDRRLPRSRTPSPPRRILKPYD